MSTPTRELENLSIGGPMATNPTPRQQSQRDRRARERAEREALIRQNTARAGPPVARASSSRSTLAAAQINVPVAGPSRTQPSYQSRAPAAGPSGTQPSYRTPARVTGHTGLIYDIQELSPNSRPRALEGLNSEEFNVDFSMRKVTEGGVYYAFQLKKPISVRISDGANGPGSVTCTCDEFQAGSSPCVHIFVSLYINSPLLAG